MHAQLVQGVVPETSLVGSAVDSLLGVLVTPVVAKPYVISLFDQGEGKDALEVRYADPHLAIHEESMVKVDYLFPRGCARSRFLLISPSWKTVQPKEIAVFRLHDMAFNCVSIKIA